MGKTRRIQGTQRNKNKTNYKHDEMKENTNKKARDRDGENRN